MNLKIFLGLTLLFFLTNAMSCFDEDVKWKIVALDVHNMNNEGRYPIASDDSIKRAAYAMNIEYKGEGKNGYIYNGTTLENCKDTIVDRRIICNYDFDSSLLAGSDVTDFFKPIGGVLSISEKEAKLYGGIYVLLHMPKPGIHSFKVQVFRKNGTYVEFDTAPVKLY